MSTALSTKRRELRDALNVAEIAAYSTAPEVAVPPLVFVTPDEPYISLEGAVFGGVIVHHQVTVVVGGGVNEGTADALDDLTEDVIHVIADLVGMFSVGRPGSIALNGQECIAVAIATQTEIRLEDS